MTFARVAVKAAVLLGTIAAGGSVVRGQVPSLPDLAIDAPRVRSSVTFQVKNFTRNDCAWVEGLLTGLGKRTLMRFDVSAANVGTSDLFLGDPTRHPDLFTWSPCHRHYHFNGYASYELLDAAETTVLYGRKQAFCLEDFEVSSLTAGPAKYTCRNQGISVGWADTYGSYLDGQWLDVTGIAPGNYTLRVIINPSDVALWQAGSINPATMALPAGSSAAQQAMRESNYSNNTAVVSVSIPLKVK